MEHKAFAYRGFMLDVSRHYMPVDAIERIIEGASVSGMTHMHWHLVDDQGWRVEIRRYPRLTEVGAHRGEAYFGAENEHEHNEGFYTQEEIRRVVAFAREKGIEIVPEIEIPGHASAMLAAYPEFGCRREVAAPDGRIVIQEQPYEYRVGTLAGIFPNLICAGRDECLDFLRNILTEIADLFPGELVHIGGDEAIKQHWRRCPDCQRRMREEGLKDEHELQRYLVLQMGEHLKRLGKRTVVWNESLDGGLLPDHFVVQHWWGNDRETAAFLAAGGQVICSETAYYYISRSYADISLKTIYEAPRIPDYAKDHPENLLGVECPLWSERVTNPARAEYLLFPRVPAVALRAMGREYPTYEAFRGAVRALEDKVEAVTGIAGAPEHDWLLPQEEADALRERERQKRFLAPEAETTWRIADAVDRIEAMERLLTKLSVPRPFALRVMDFAFAQLPEFCGTVPEANGDGADVMAQHLLLAVKNRKDGPWKGIPEQIFLDTMGCFPRFVGEHMRSTGWYAFDRGFWTTRQAAAKLLRIGELEYELLENDGERVVSLHIPSDVHLGDAAALNQSVSDARSFLRTYRPEWADAPIRCASWLLSPVLRELLDEGSNILRFQAAFDMLGVIPESDGVLEWVFNLTGAQQKDADLSALPEDTSLRRKVKELMLMGGHVGVGRGVLARAFR